MSGSQSRTTTAQAGAFFDRYTLPKVALAVILTASLFGTWVTTSLNGTASVAYTVAKWGYFVALGVLTGGFVWKHTFVRPADLGDGTADYCADMYVRFGSISAGMLIVLVVGGVAVLWKYLEIFGWTTFVIGYGTLVSTLVMLTAVTTYRRGDVEQQFRSTIGLATLGLALAVVVMTAVIETAIRGLDLFAAEARILHLLAFTVWVGGAVWNIFVAVPTGQKQPTSDVVEAAGEQLERFRWAVRFIIPILLLTGLYQAMDSIGVDIELYVGSVVGLAILGKLGLIGLLILIFKLCPMWRACSPIEGVCELDDTGGGEAGGCDVRNSESTAPSSEVTGDG